MSKEITDWIKYELYPTLFESIDTALPEFSFKRRGRNWISSNKRKITGEEGDSIGKVYVWETAPGFIKDFTRETSSIVDYVIKRDGVEFIQAAKTLADVVGLQLPKGEINQESYQRYKDQATLLEDCNRYFTDCLANSTGADEVRAYLSSRGYSDEDVKAMELGYIPDQDKLFKYLLSKGYSQSLIDEVVKLNKGIGSTHRLTIPYRSGGSVKGFKFRTVGDATPKYLNSTGLDRLGDSIGKVYVWETAPGFIKDFTRETSSIVDYVIKRDGVEFIQAAKTLADVVGLQLPKGEINQESYQRYKDQATLLEDCNRYFTDCLANSTGADEVRAYLSSRGYSDEDVKAMELGYIPDQDKLFKYLLSKGYSQSLIDEVVKLNKGIGSTHRLTIPYRSGGSVKGFKFRTVGDATPKYLNSTGLDRLGGFFNLSGIKGDKDVVIVEGELDSLSATARGVENVVATGGSSIASDQVKDAIRRGAKSFTLCFDTEPGKEEETAKRITSAIEVILGEGVNRVYIVTLPDLGGGKTDPDRLIKESGVEAFREALSSRLTYGAYLGSKLLEEYLSKANQSGEIDYKERDLLREKVVEIRSKLSAQDRIDFNSNLVEPLSSHGFTEDLLSELEENYKTATEEAIRNKKVDELLRKVGTIPDKGEAIKELKEGLKNIDASTGKGLLPPPISFTTLLDEIATLPPAYKTGYSSLDSFIGFTPGAITLIAGRPSHGKTTFMFNLLLEMSRLYKDESFYFFTYEEPLKNISIKLLNRLIDTDLSGYFREVRDLSTPTNYEFIKSYIKARRTDISQIEEGKKQLQELIDSQRIKANRS